MATRVGLAKIWMTPLDWSTPKTPTLMQNSGIYLKCELSYCDFCVEISNFSLPWQQRLVWHKFHLHSEIGSSRKPLFDTRILMLFHRKADLLPTFWWNVPIFVTMATMVDLAKIWMTPLHWPTSKTVTLMQTVGSILNATWVIVIFVWKFPNFRYRGNRGWVLHKFHLYI